LEGAILMKWERGPEATSKMHRRHRSRAEADQLAAEYEASGLTREAFCRQREVPLKTLCRYVTRYWREKGDTPQSPRLMQVEVTAPGCVSGALNVLVRGGRRIEVSRGFDAATLRQLITVLEQA
jgi:hypothetical protein